MAYRIERFREPADGVAIEREEGGRPILIIPFPKDRFHRAEPLDDDTLLFIGGKDAPGHPWNTLLLAVYDIRAGCFTRRAEIAGVTGRHHLLSRDRSRLFVGGGGIAVVDLRTFALLKTYDCYSLDGETGRAAAYADWPGGYGEARQAGWTHISVRLPYEFGETKDGHIMFVERIGVSPFIIEPSLQQMALTIDTQSDDVQARVLVRTDGVGPLSRIDPQADLAFISSQQIAVFRAFAPSPQAARIGGAWRPGESAPEGAERGEPRYGLPLHVWRLADADALPMTVVVRLEPSARWRLGLETSRFWKPEDKALRDGALRMLDSLPAGAGAEDYVRWSLAARALVYDIAEDPHDGKIWIAFADDCVRSLDSDGRLGALIRLAGEPSQMYGPSLTFENDGALTVRRFPRNGSGLYRFDPRQFKGIAGPVSIEPLALDTHPNRHAKAFAAFVRQQTRKRFAVPDWTRESCAAALEKQAKMIRKSFGDMVVASSLRLNFAYRVGKSTLDEASFFAGLVERDVPVVPELRTLLTTYLQALGEGGEGVQPWEDPDEGIGGLGSALRALAILDPDALDIVRTYLEKRDGEHEGYCWSAVVPAYFDRHGWRSAETVRFGIYAVFNRFWGGAHPYGLDGLREAMQEHTTPADITGMVRREADTFGRKPDWGYDMGVYLEAFCRLLDPAIPFEAVVLDALRHDEELPGDLGRSPA